MRATFTAIWLLLVGLIACRAEAHFIWLERQAGDDGKPRILAYFGESAGPGEKHLIGKIAHTKAWLRSADGNATEVSLGKPAEGDVPALSAICADSSSTSIEAFCDYGVYSHGGPGFLLQYYAKHLTGDWTNNTDKLARAEKLTFDIVPSVKDGKLALTVLYQGKPAAEKELVVIDPAEKQHDLKTNADGQASLPELIAGRYAIRAGHIEADKSGERDGKKYTQIWHYGTLTFDLPTSIAKAVKVEKKASDPSAVELLAKARAGRAVWEKFPGFEAELTISTANERQTTKAKIDENGIVTSDLEKGALSDWLDEQLASMVQHRMPDGEVSQGNVTFADDDKSHPLGRMIDLGDPKMGSAYRIKDDIIYEVNRNAGPTMRFTISVLEIERNAEGKYLPRSFTMNFFDSKTGEVKTSLAFLNEWQRVGTFDLPKTIVEVNAHAGKSETRRIEFRNVRLMQ